VRDATGELAHGLHFLCLAQGLLRFVESGLLAQLVGDVHPGGEGADLRAVGRAQHLELELVLALGDGRVAELALDGEGLAGHGALPQRQRGLHVRPRAVEQRGQAVARCRAHAVHALVLVGVGLVDRQEAVVPVEHLDEGVGGLHDGGQHVALRRALGQGGGVVFFVLHIAGDAVDQAVLGHRHPRQPAPAAGLRAVAVLEAQHGQAALAGIRPGALAGGQVVGVHQLTKAHVLHLVFGPAQGAFPGGVGGLEVPAGVDHAQQLGAHGPGAAA